MSKKIWFTGLLSCIIFFSCSMVAFAADGVLSVSGVQANAGDEVNVTVNMDENPGIVSMILRVDYDEKYLTLKNVVDAKNLGSTMHSDNFNKAPYLLCWVNDTVPKNFINTGKLVTLTFQVADNVPANTDLPIRLSYDSDNYDIFDVDLQKVEFTLKDGNIHIGTESGMGNGTGSSNNTGTTVSETGISSEQDNPVNVKQEAEQYNHYLVLQINNRMMQLNGKTVENDVAPVIMNNRTMVPIRVILESLGGTADWDEQTRTVTLNIQDKELTMTIDKVIDGFDVAPVIYKDRTYVPVRYVSEQVGAKVDWIEATRQIIVKM